MNQSVSTEAHGRLCVALLVLLGLSLGCSEFIVIGIEPQLATAFNVSVSQTGTLVSAASITYAIMTPLLAITTGRFKRYTLMVAYSIVFCLGNLLAAVAPSFGVLLVARVLMGSVSGALLAVGVTFLPELMAAEKVSFALSIVYGAFSVAMVLATSGGKMLTEALGWHVTMVVTLLLAVVVCALCLVILPKTGETDEPSTIAEQLGLLKEPQVISGILIFVFGVGSVYVFYGYVTPYLQTVLGMAPLDASMVLLVYGVMCFFSNLLSGFVDARFGLKGLVVTFIVQACILFGIFMVGAQLMPALGLILVLGLSMYILSVSCVTMFMRTARTSHPKAMTLASSIEPTAFNLGITFGTAVGGWVIDGPGITKAGLVGGCFSLVACALVVLTMYLDRRGHTQKAA